MAKCKITISFLFLFFFATFINTLSAEEIKVYPGEGIQDAINQAVSNDTVFVYAGTYTEDVTMKDGVDLVGESYARVIIKGHVFFQDANCTLKNITVLFPESSFLSYSNDYYLDWKLEADAGITIINSAPTIQNCIIKSDLETINSLHPETPDLEYYGKAIQIWNLYNIPDTAPRIENTLIRDTDCGIYYFSQALGGAIYGDIKNNTFYHNKVGVLLRMHKENPHIYNNIFDKCNDAAICFVYEDGTLLNDRTANIFYNLFNDSSSNVFVNSSQDSLSIVNVRGNVGLDPSDPLYLIVTENMFYLDPDSPARNISDAGSYVGAHPTDKLDPTVTILYPALTDKKFMSIVNLSVSGQISDNIGIAHVLVNAQPAFIDDMEFLATIPITYGLNSIDATVHDLAGRTNVDSREIYLFIAPVEPPQE